MKRLRLCSLLFLVSVMEVLAQDAMLSKEEAVVKALENNFGIQVAKNNIEIAENNKSILNSGYLPSLVGNAGASYQRDDSTFEFPGQFLTDPNTRETLLDEVRYFKCASRCHK